MCERGVKFNLKYKIYFYMNSLNVRSEDSTISTQQSTEDITEASEMTDSMYILDGKFLKIKSKMDKNKVIATCVTCESRHLEIKGSLSSTSNFKSHLKRRHDQSVIDSYENYLSEND